MEIYDFEIRQNVNGYSHTIQMPKQVLHQLFDSNPFDLREHPRIIKEGLDLSSACTYGSTGHLVCRAFHKVRGKVGADSLEGVLDNLIEFAGDEKLDYVQISLLAEGENGLGRVYLRKITWNENFLIEEDYQHRKRGPVLVTAPLFRIFAERLMK